MAFYFLSQNETDRKALMLCDSGFECDGEVVAILVNESLEEFCWEGVIPTSIQEGARGSSRESRAFATISSPMKFFFKRNACFLRRL